MNIRKCFSTTKKALDLFVDAVNGVAQAEARGIIADAFMAASVTGLAKPGAGIRGIATGAARRMLVAETLARQSGPGLCGRRGKSCGP